MSEALSHGKSWIGSDESFGEEPIRCVKSLPDMENWEKSCAYFDHLGFINGISTAIQGKRINDDIYISETMAKLLDIFDQLNKFVDEIPPVDQPQRFGNKAYRSWWRKMNQNIFIMLQNALPQEKCHLFIEIGYYITESFGNSVRIDYGTGHEMSFIFFMCSLFKAEILKEEDNVAAALRLFYTYLLFVRRLQTTYRMEPAGSQGVWALDDFQFVPFIWGSAQLAYNSPFEPEKFLEESIINEFKDEYMWISCIDYINKVKTGHFAEHSNQLWGISSVPTWVKINTGLMKMYHREFMGKFPIIQHVFFGKLMSFQPVKQGTFVQNARLGYMPTRPSQASAKSNAELMPPPSPITKSQISISLAPTEHDPKRTDTSNETSAD